MFALLGVNFGTLAFRSPARRALIPQLVPREQLHLAATLQAFVYSLIVSRLPPERRVVSHVLPADALACLHAEQGCSAAWSGLLLQCATDTGCRISISSASQSPLTSPTIMLLIAAGSCGRKSGWFHCVNSG